MPSFVFSPKASKLFISILNNLIIINTIARTTTGKIGRISFLLILLGLLLQIDLRKVINERFQFLCYRMINVVFLLFNINFRIKIVISLLYKSRLILSLILLLSFVITTKPPQFIFQDITKSH